MQKGHLGGWGWVAEARLPLLGEALLAPVQQVNSESFKNICNTVDYLMLTDIASFNSLGLQSSEVYLWEFLISPKYERPPER